ncbi:MAG: ABC transporter permease [Spirochaetaceae bacterium]|nr:ABC transporter permease [Spirochaetaceae bacterium]
MRNLPASYVEQKAMQLSSSPGALHSYHEWVALLASSYGLDKGIIPGFFSWWGNMLQGNFGDSWYYNMPVLQKFFAVIPDSLWLALFVMIFQYAIYIPLGILAARKQYKPSDYIITVLAMIGISLPLFFVATMFKLLFSVELGWFDLYGKVGRNYPFLSPWGQFWDIVQHYILPVSVATIVSIGGGMRMTRTNMLEVLQSDYIRTARAKGLPERYVVYRHAFRNTLVILVTGLGGILPGLFSGFLTTEILFQLPGIGYTSYMAILQGDIPFTMFFLVFMAFLTLIGTLISDILYAAADPRIRLSSK